MTRQKLAAAVPALSARADGIGAEAADLYEAVVAVREAVIGMNAQLSELTALLRAATPAERVTRVGNLADPEPADDFVLRTLGDIDQMPRNKLEEYCARSADVDPDSCRQAVMPKPVRTGGTITGHRAHGRFAPLQRALGLDAHQASEVLFMWRWLAGRPDPEEMPGSWPTRYSYLRAVPQERCEAFLAELLD